MIFYRLMSKKEYEVKKIKENSDSFSENINTHMYEPKKNYIHLFLNAESCFESFERIDYTKCLVGKFDIPDEVVCKYGIGLGGYDFLYNNYDKRYRHMDYQNKKNNYCFWLPEIALPEDDFSYDWCIETVIAGTERNRGYLPFEFETDLVSYREIINDGYLYGYDSKDELLKEYNDIIKTKKKIIKILKTTRKININPECLNNDSFIASKILINYALKNKMIEKESDIYISISKEIMKGAINIDNKEEKAGDYVVINKNYRHTSRTFCATLDQLGINVDRDILYSVTSENDIVMDYVLIKNKLFKS